MSLRDYLTGQQARLQQLERTLLEERQQLLARDIDGRELERLAKVKSELLAELERQEGLRRRVQQHEAWAPGPEGAREAAARAGCEPLWTSVMQLGEQVARNNNRNGELIALRTSQNQKLLNALHDARGHHLYGPDGQSTPRGSQLDSRV